MARLLGEAEALDRGRDADRADPGTHEFQADIDALRAFQLYWEGDAEHALERAARARRSTTRRAGFERTLAVLYEAGALAMLGRPEEGLRSLDEAIDDDRAEGGRHVGEFLTAQAIILLYAGNLDACRDRARKILETHETVPLPEYWLGYAHYFHGVVAYERNRLDEAHACFLRLEPLRYHLATRVYHDSVIGISLVARASGHPAEAEVHAAAARAFALEVADPMSLRASAAHDVGMRLAASLEPTAEPVPPLAADAMSFWLEAPGVIHGERLMRGGAPDGPRAALASV